MALRIESRPAGGRGYATAPSRTPRTPRTSDRSATGLVQHGRRPSLDGGRAAASSPERACLLAENDAVVTDGAVLNYRDLDRRANQVARHLIDQGIEPGDRVGLLFDKSVETYVALLAVMKVNAAYVPLDPGFPTERIGFILTDANVKAVVSMSGFGARSPRSPCAKSCSTPPSRPSTQNRPRPSPTTRSAAGRPGLLHHLYLGNDRQSQGRRHRAPSICNFVRVAAERYGFAPGDRVYQGMTIAFDFSVEEIWVPLMAGATLVPAARASRCSGTSSPISCGIEGHVPRLLPDPAGDDRDGAASAADPAGRGRGLPAQPRGPLAPARPPHPELLRADRGHRHRDLGRIDPGQAGHHRPAAADLFDRHPRSGRGPDRRARRARRDRDRRHRPRRRLPQPR